MKRDVVPAVSFFLSYFSTQRSLLTLLLIPLSQTNLPQLSTDVGAKSQRKHAFVRKLST